MSNRQTKEQYKPATEEQDGISSVGLCRHGNERHHHGGLVGRVVGDDVVVHLGPEGEVAKGGGPRVHENADGDCTGRGDRELFDISVLHAGIDWDHRDMALKKIHIKQDEREMRRCSPDNQSR